VARRLQIGPKSGFTAFTKADRLQLKRTPAIHTTLPKPAPNGTTLLWEGDASRFAAIAGELERYQPLSKFRLTKYRRRNGVPPESGRADVADGRV
jgi:hypothetical protein